MFSALSGRATIALFRVAVHVSDIVATTQHVQVFSSTLPRVIGLIMAPSANPAPDCTTDFVKTIIKGVGSIVQVLMGIGVAIAVIGIIIGGLMRATSFGNERRIAMSNTAITCAVVGLVIVLVGASAGNALPGWFSSAAVDANCQVVQPPAAP